MSLGGFLFSLIKITYMQVVKVQDTAILIQDGDIKAWVDVWIDKEGEICYDWNKYIFYEGDKEQQKWQANTDNFIEATELAVEALERAGAIIPHNDGKYIYPVDFDLIN